MGNKTANAHLSFDATVRLGGVHHQVDAFATRLDFPWISVRLAGELLVVGQRFQTLDLTLQTALAFAQATMQEEYSMRRANRVKIVFNFFGNPNLLGLTANVSSTSTASSLHVGYPTTIQPLCRQSGFMRRFCKSPTMNGSEQRL